MRFWVRQLVFHVVVREHRCDIISRFETWKKNVLSCSHNFQRIVKDENRETERVCVSVYVCVCLSSVSSPFANVLFSTCSIVQVLTQYDFCVVFGVANLILRNGRSTIFTRHANIPLPRAFGHFVKVDLSCAGNAK